jgi:two-component system sensor histidine kinase RegB
MDFTTLFRLKENLNLDKKTLAILRWIAIAGQFLAICIVYFFLDFKFPLVASLVIILIGSISNLYLQFVVKAARIKDIFAGLILIYDLIQLSLLLYLTGGISNPFSILLIIPTIVSSTFLSMGTTIVLGSFTFLSLFLLTIFHYPLPGIHENAFTFPKFYLMGFFISIIIGLIFLSYFGIRFAGETKKRSEALNKLQEIIAKEYELESLGGQAAAAAHSLGTPLATISVVVKELRKEISQDSKISKDLDLLLSQTKRCSEILKKISKKQIIEDKFFTLTKFEDLLEEIRESFKTTSEKEISLDIEKDQGKNSVQRSPEIIYGLRNFIGNSVKFSKKNIFIRIDSNAANVNIIIEDDGPGFPEDVIQILGEPYIRSKSQEISSKSGTGLGTFLGKTLLERKGASLKFSKSEKLGGAKVSINFPVNNLR